MEKLRLSKCAVYLFYRSKFFTQIRTLQTSQVFLSQTDDGNQDDSSPGSESLESLLGGMKITKSESNDAKQRFLNFQRSRRGRETKDRAISRSFQETLQTAELEKSGESRLDFMSKLRAKRKSSQQQRRAATQEMPGDGKIERQFDGLDDAAFAQTGEGIVFERYPEEGDDQNRMGGRRDRHKRASLQETFQRAQLEKIDKNELPELRIEPELLEAAKSVAESLPGDVKETESDLLKQLRSHDEATAAGKKGEAADFSNLMSGLKVKQQPSKKHKEGMSTALGYDNRYEDSILVDSGLPGDGLSREVGSKGREAPYRRQRRRSLFDRHRLFIFSPKSESEQESKLVAASMEMKTKPPSIWEIEHQKDLESLVAIQPRNGFEEMIEWTKEGKLWKYPIDNEQGLEEEQHVGFHEHVFLDHHLEKFPKKGPVRHFMELVITGLSKNPYITVQQKKDHIDWFQQYFKEKEDVLREAGALPQDDRKQLEN
ncbi:small ribosomal subunit protein mS31-like [Ptychodera flava]|uniref:small ribosomal subunit protein mS31-like n=1 Tax=Ptychodera flava TaxID=63121 RepID=UPI00396A4975